MTLDSPLSNNAIVVFKSPLIGCKPLGKISSTTTFVALEGPLLVTVIVNVISPPIVLIFTSAILTTVKSTTGVTFTVAVLFLIVDSSLQLVCATLSNVPLVNTRTTIHTEYVFSLAILETFQVTVLPDNL